MSKIYSPEAVGRAGPITAVEFILIAVVPAVVVAVAKPVGLHADGGVLTLEVVRGASHFWATVLGLVRRMFVLAVIDTVANLKEQ